MVSLTRLFENPKTGRPILVGFLLVATFAGVAARDMATIKNNLHKQEQTIQHLDKTDVELSGTIKNKQEVKQEKLTELQTLEQQHQSIEAERQKLAQEAS